jgi:acyl dehydratase
MMGLHYEDLHVGMAYELGSYQFTQESIAAFSSRFAPLPCYAITAVGLHVCCGWMTCFLKTAEQNCLERKNLDYVLPEIGPGAGLVNVSWPLPVHAGDCISHRIEVVAMRELESKPAWGLISALCEGRNQHGNLVVSFVTKMLTAKRI